MSLLELDSAHQSKQSPGLLKVYEQNMILLFAAFECLVCVCIKTHIFVPRVQNYTLEKRKGTWMERLSPAQGADSGLGLLDLEQGIPSCHLLSLVHP